MKWRYSLRWKLPSPCPGEHELVSEVVEAGQPAPASVMSRWVAGAGYAVCLDFISDRQVCRWSEERKAAVRRRNLEKRINRHAPLFADELIAVTNGAIVIHTQRLKSDPGGNLLS
ncbi:theronine dehydrogenase [Escherichia coli]